MSSRAKPIDLDQCLADRDPRARQSFDPVQANIAALAEVKIRAKECRLHDEVLGLPHEVWQAAA